MSDNFMVRKVQ